MKKLEAKRDHLKDWLERHRKAQDAVPFVQMNLDITEWEIQALSNRPDEADEIPLGDLESKFGSEYDHLTRALPMMPEYDADALPTLTAVTTSGSADVFAYVTRVGSLGTPDACVYSQKYTVAYRELQAAQSRPKNVRDLLRKLGNPNTLQRFDRALNACFAATSGTGERTAAAGEMRTLLDGVQGDLFTKARKQPSENMTWETMAERLSTGKPRGMAHQRLINEKNTRSSLISQLSDVLKDREGRSPVNLDDLWSQLLDHLFIVLRLVTI